MASETQGERFVNEVKTKSEDLRRIIRDARDKSGKTEKQINEDYSKLMKEQGLVGLTAIMTKMRDKRQDVILNRTQATCLAAALGIDPEPLYPMPSPQAELEIPAPTLSKQEQNIKAAFPGEGAATATASKKPASDNSRKISAGCYETEKGLQFLINMALTQTQFDRLTLSIPAYMMRTEPQGEFIYARAQVPIFPYQAEILMRAIYGAQ